MTPERAAMRHALDIFLAEMQDYIRATLQSAYGPDWFVGQVLPHLPSRYQRRHLKRAYVDGRDPALLLDVGEFRTVLSAHAKLFPASLQVGQLVKSLDIIRKVRNELSHPPFDSSLNAEQLFGLCRDVLERCGRLDAARHIEAMEAVYAPRALSRDQQSDTTAEGKLARLLDRALSRDQQPDTTAEDELARLLDQHRENLRNDIEESLSELIQDAILKRQDRRLTPDEGISNGLRIFQRDMRAYIRSVLQRAHGADWCETQVAPLFPGKGRRGERILQALEQGKSPRAPAGCRLVSEGDRRAWRSLPQGDPRG